MSELTWSQQQPGWYRTDLNDVDQDATGVLRWEVRRLADRRWEVFSVTGNWERRRHGATYTLREAKEAVGNFHRSNLARPLTTR